MSHLNNAGWESAHDAANADLIIINSCGFIESAKLESINAVLGWRKLYPNKKILLAGCLAQRYSQDLAESLPEADGFFGVEDISRIASAAHDVCEGSIISHSSHNTGHRPLLSLPGSAYVKISEGCNNRCSYCAIPLIRGGLVCRTIPDIREECRALLERGIKELCLVGQDLGSYQSGGCGLPELLAEISSLPGQFWVRLLYIHPDHFPLAVLDIMEKDGRFLPYFDIPFQHSSAKILRAMNRNGSAESHLALIETIRRRLPAAIIRSTFLLGFPGENEKDFCALVDFQDKARLDWLGCFTYSREEDTPAWSLSGQVPQRAAERRKKIIEERQVPITEHMLDRFIGKRCDVLIEEKYHEDFTRGHRGTEDTEGMGDHIFSDNISPEYLGRLYCQAPEVDGIVLVSGCNNAQPGDLVPCTVVGRRGFDLEVEA